MDKELFILRHAEAKPSEFGKIDHERELSDTGKKEAILMGNLMKESKQIPELILVSDATRTKQTCDNLIKGMKPNKLPIIKQHNLIYSADTSQLLELVSKQNDKFDKIMIIGHNPTVPAFVDYLSGYTCPSYATCGLTTLSLPLSNWGLSSKGIYHFKSYKFPSMFH